MKKVRILISVIFLFVNLLSFSQTLPWKKSYGGSNDDRASAITLTSDGGCAIAGYSYSNDYDVTNNHGSSDYWVVKLDINGNIEWQKSLGGTNYDNATSIIQTNDGGYIIAGYSASNDSIITDNHGYNDYWIVKLNAQGDLEWQKSYGGSSYDNATSIIQTNDGGYVVAGYSYSNDGDVSGNHGDCDYWIIKLDPSGNLIWQKTIGGSSSDYANSIVQTSDNGFIVAGKSSSNDGDIDNDNHGSFDYWIVKLDNSGNIQWKKSYGGTNDEGANFILQTPDNGYIIAGSSESGDGDLSGHYGGSDYWIIKINATGDIVWQNYYGGSDFDMASSVTFTQDGGYIIAGSSESQNGDITNAYYHNNYWIVKLDSLGNKKWQKIFGGNYYDYATSIIQATDGGYLVAGSSSSDDGDITDHHGSINNMDYWIINLKYYISSTNSCYGTNTGRATVEWFGNIEPEYIWSNGDTTATADSLQPGMYYVSITNGNDTVIDSVYIDENPAINISFNKYDVHCYGGNDGSIKANVMGGILPYSYLWNTGQTTDSISGLYAGTYILTITDNIGCQAIDSVTLTEPTPIQDSINYTNPTYCYNSCDGSATVYAWGGTPPYNYQWSNNTLSQTTQICSNESYTVTIIDNNGCTVTDSIPAFFNDSIKICVVTIDTATGKCLIVWERPENPALNGFAVFKETSANYYNLIGTVNWEDMTQFLDTNSTPAAYAHSYKICMIDTCGNYTPLSYYHKTMYLTANQGTNQNEVALLWTHYEDESGEFQPLRYYIYRKNLPDQPYYQLIDSVPANITNYNDINPPAGFLYYLVLTPHDNCIPTSIDKAQGGPYNYSISNIDDYEVQQQFANSAQIFVPVSVYPNPVKNKLTVEIYNPQGYTHNIRIINANGKTVYETNTTSNKVEINRGDLPSGIYNITITGNKKVYNRKIILE